MSYISDLRKYIGNNPLIIIGSTVVVLNEKKEILLNLRSDTNDWGIIGGIMELGESLEETASRELFEEANLTAEKYEFLTMISGKEMYFKYPNGDETYTVTAVYLAKGIKGSLNINDGESKQLKYFGFDNIPALESRSEIVMDWLRKNL